MIAFAGFVNVLAGGLTMIVSYLALAESHGVLRFFAYDRLSPRGKKTWLAGLLLIALGAVVEILALALRRAGA